jgi:hypothetical protein
LRESADKASSGGGGDPDQTQKVDVRHQSTLCQCRLYDGRSQGNELRAKLCVPLVVWRCRRQTSSTSTTNGNHQSLEPFGKMLVHGQVGLDQSGKQDIGRVLFNQFARDFGTIVMNV